MAQRERCFGGAERRLAGSVESLQNVEIGELRKAARNRLGEIYFPLLHQL
jgi:hypothetical protein